MNPIILTTIPQCIALTITPRRPPPIKFNLSIRLSGFRGIVESALIKRSIIKVLNRILMLISCANQFFPSNLTISQIVKWLSWKRKRANQISICRVSWGCRILWLHLCRGVRPPLTSVLDMTLNNLMVRFQQCWSFGECRVPLHCHCS